MATVLRSFHNYSTCPKAVRRARSPCRRQAAAGLRQSLEEEGFAVTERRTAGSRPEGPFQNYDAIILDLMLPKKDGLDKGWRSSE